MFEKEKLDSIETNINSITLVCELKRERQKMDDHTWLTSWYLFCTQKNKRGEKQKNAHQTIDTYKIVVYKKIFPMSL